MQVGDLVIVSCAATNSKQAVVITEVDEKQKHILYSVCPGHTSWARFDQVSLVPGQAGIIPELRNAMNGIFIVELLEV